MGKPPAQEPGRLGRVCNTIFQFTLNPQEETSHASAISSSEERFRGMKIGVE